LVDLLVDFRECREINQAVEDSRQREENTEKIFFIHKRLIFPPRMTPIVRTPSALHQKTIEG